MAPFFGGWTVGAEQSRNEKSISEEIWYIFGINEYIQRFDNNIFIYITSKVVIIVLWPRETSSDNMEFPGEEDPDGEVLSSIIGVPNTFSRGSSAAFQLDDRTDEQPSTASVLTFSLFWIFTILVVYCGEREG